MANFNEALHLTAINEGGYANDPSDHGGETYAGISRKFWPNWIGWHTIDAYKNLWGAKGINEAMKTNDGIQLAVKQFYKSNFWDVNKLDQINDQQLADSVYDFGVNSGVDYAARLLQRVVGVTEDGIVGPHTLEAVNSGNAETIYNRYNALRKWFYNSLATTSTQHKFLASWLSRLKPYVA